MAAHEALAGLAGFLILVILIKHSKRLTGYPRPVAVLGVQQPSVDRSFPAFATFMARMLGVPADQVVTDATFVRLDPLLTIAEFLELVEDLSDKFHVSFDIDAVNRAIDFDGVPSPKLYDSVPSTTTVGMLYDLLRSARRLRPAPAPVRSH